MGSLGCSPTPSEDPSAVVDKAVVDNTVVDNTGQADGSAESPSVAATTAKSGDTKPIDDDTPEPSAESATEDDPGATRVATTLSPIDETLDVDALLEMRLSDDLLDMGWIQLFDGQSLLGWVNDGDANWNVIDGQLVADSGERGLLRTTSQFADYELMVEFLADPTTNSGVFLRCSEETIVPGENCYELNIAPPENPFPTGSLVDMEKVDNEALQSVEYSQWHTFHALVDGGHIQIWFDGIPILDRNDESEIQRGTIGLQFRDGPIRFRNVRLRPILFDQVLPSETLDRWTIPENSDAEFRIENESLIVSGGRAQAELLQPMGDFVLQAKTKTLTDNANSGIFLRCMLGSDMNGYECQISNVFEEDRRRPADWGTGGIFKRSPARAVLGNDQEDVYLTVATLGNHFSTWVNGIQVLDFVDEREFHENPRLGRRDEAGSIMIQAHDKDSQVEFSQLRMMNLP
jgi:hypothetical protein